MSERLEDAVLLLRHPNEKRHRQIGKIVTLPGGKRLYVFNWKRSSGLCRALQAIGIEPATLKAMQQFGAEEIRYLDVEERQTLSTTRSEVIARGVLRSFGHGEMYHLPLDRWQTTPGMARYPFVQRMHPIEWCEPEERPQAQPKAAPAGPQQLVLL